ncbi:MAG: hypothetical protein L0J77_05325 [Marinobacter sp.]|nr:hypothetical protein [Marinobacter sp.]
MKNDNLKRGGDYSIAQLGDPVVLTLSVGFVVLFVAFSLFDLEGVASLVSTSFAWTAKVFGTYFQMLLLATFFIAALRKGLDFLLNEDKSQPPKLIYQDADLCVVDAQKKRYSAMPAWRLSWATQNAAPGCRRRHKRQRLRTSKMNPYPANTN